MIWPVVTLLFAKRRRMSSAWAISCASTKPPTADPRLDVHILPGLSQAEPPDVMRGEETQIAGMLAATPDFDGLVCLPGTHTKWARVSEGRVTDFRTAMTGELFALVSGHSTLSSFTAEGWNEAMPRARAAPASPPC